MKKLLTSLAAVLFCLLSSPAWAQPANNPCGSATNITLLDSTCVAGYTTAGATFDTYVGSCANGSNNVWFSFVAQGQTLDITVNGAGGSRPEIALMDTTGGLCNIATNLQINCTTGAGNYSTITLTSPINLTVGERYYFQVTNRGAGTPGAFSLCVDNPIDLPSPGQDCSSRLQICSNTTVSGNSSGFDTQELNAGNDGCLSGEHNSSWFQLNVGTGGTLEMVITPSNGSDDYDFALWGPGGSCPPAAAPVRCNYAAHPRFLGCGTNTNPTGMTAAGVGTSAAACDNTPYVSALNVLAGQVYYLVVDGFNSQPDPFTMSFGGSATLSCILPLDDFSLNGKATEAGNELTWIQPELNHAETFLVEHSTDGQQFSVAEEIAVVPAALHQWFHPEAASGSHYYRISIPQVNGEAVFSETIELWRQPGGNQLIAVKPSVTDDVFELQVFNASGESLLAEMKTLSGALVKTIEVGSTSGTQSQQVNVSDLQAGVYFVSLRGVAGKVLRVVVM